MYHYSEHLENVALLHCYEGHSYMISLVIELVVCSEAEIYLFGGCVTSWKAASGKDLLFVRPDAVFNGQKPIRFCCH